MDSRRNRTPYCRFGVYLGLQASKWNATLWSVDPDAWGCDEAILS